MFIKIEDRIYNVYSRNKVIDLQNKGYFFEEPLFQVDSCFKTCFQYMP